MMNSMTNVYRQSSYWLEVQNLETLHRFLQVDTNSPSGLVWKSQSRNGRTTPGKTAGSRTDRGYFSVHVKGVRYYCHRLVLVLSGVNPPSPSHFCDHINRNKSDNRLENLRWMTKGQNIANKNYKSSSGFRYARKTKSGSYQANYRLYGTNKTIYCGTFSSPFAAHIAAISHKLEKQWNP